MVDTYIFNKILYYPSKIKSSEDIIEIFEIKFKKWIENFQNLFWKYILFSFCIFSFFFETKTLGIISIMLKNEN
jgi:hypothetical protein